VRSCDVASPASVAAWADELAADLASAASGTAGGGGGGGAGLDLVIHNAGIANWAPLKNITADDMSAAFTVNTVGPVLTTQQLLRVGAIGETSRPCTAAFMTSKMGSCADCASGGSLAYRASKAALNVVVRALAVDLAGRGVTATLLHPGWVETDMTRNAPTPVSESVAGMLGVLEAGAAGELDLAGAWYDYKREVVPW
jgi:NAD(P)-dependent dehydrogenase (short-subunit alcohol dehydrogenase family)